MAYVQATQTTGFDLIARVDAALSAFKTSRELSRRYKTTVRELAGMTDRDLADIGISRYDIHNIAEQHVYG